MKPRSHVGPLIPGTEAYYIAVETVLKQITNMKANTATRAGAAFNRIGASREEANEDPIKTSINSNSVKYFGKKTFTYLQVEQTLRNILSDAEIQIPLFEPPKAPPRYNFAGAAAAASAAQDPPPPLNVRHVSKMQATGKITAAAGAAPNIWTWPVPGAPVAGDGGAGAAAGAAAGARAVAGAASPNPPTPPNCDNNPGGCTIVGGRRSNKARTTMITRKSKKSKKSKKRTSRKM